MDETKYQVFVSSTYVDLIEARKKVIETVLSLYHFPVGMEMFSADDSEQWEIIKETIDMSDYYVIVIGHKYGSLSDEGISYTEREYDYAKSLGIPVLAFIRNRDLQTSPKERETDSALIAKLDSFIKKAQANKMCDFWDQIDDLATKVAIALPKIMRRTPRVGWVRGDLATPKEVSNELAELSTENRTLRQKLREYESQLHVDMPVLELSMIDNGLNLLFSNSYDKQSYLPYLSKEDIPVEFREHVTDIEIEKYNMSTPSNDVVDNYNNAMFMYSNYKNNSIATIPKLKNVGRTVATDIHIEIELPEFLVALTYDNEEIFTIPPTINIPETPVEMMKRRIRGKEALGGIFQILRDRESGSKSYVGGLPLNVINNHMSTLKRITPLNAKDWIVYGDNIITLRAQKLIQSLSIDFDEITLIPVAEGQGMINFKLVCEELKEPLQFSRQVTVSKIQ